MFSHIANTLTGGDEIGNSGDDSSKINKKDPEAVTRLLQWRVNTLLLKGNRLAGYYQKVKLDRYEGTIDGGSVDGWEALKNVPQNQLDGLTLKFRKSTDTLQNKAKRRHNTLKAKLSRAELGLKTFIKNPKKPSASIVAMIEAEQASSDAEDLIDELEIKMLIEQLKVDTHDLQYKAGYFTYFRDGPVKVLDASGLDRELRYAMPRAYMVQNVVDLENELAAARELKKNIVAGNWTYDHKSSMASGEWRYGRRPRGMSWFFYCQNGFPEWGLKDAIIAWTTEWLKTMKKLHYQSGTAWDEKTALSYWRPMIQELLSPSLRDEN